MTWPVVIKAGASLHQTLATVRFDRWGSPTQQTVFVCDTWPAGLTWAKDQGHRHALFVNSGTVFTNWDDFCQLVNNYPHQGLIGHLIARADTPLYLDDQCWFMDLDLFDVSDWSATHVCHPQAVRSEQNLHDDYTPLWVRPGAVSATVEISHFTQVWIARQLNLNRLIVNWNNACRDIKHYMYDNQLPKNMFRDYDDLATNQLWLFNNEPMVMINQPCLVSPGSGLSWILNIIQPRTERMHMVDISRAQINFCQHLWQHWDGTDYGTVAWNFVQENNIIHCQFDRTDLSAMDRARLKGRTRFIDYVNTVFAKLVPDTFSEQWQQARRDKTVVFYNDSLLDWVINNTAVDYDHVWESNVLDYKWTLLHSTPEQFELYKARRR